MVGVGECESLEETASGSSGPNTLKDVPSWHRLGVYMQTESHNTHATVWFVPTSNIRAAPPSSFPSLSSPNPGRFLFALFVSSQDAEAGV